jgi:hypothetical protein
VDERLTTAAAFLAEAVFASRARQAAGVSLLRTAERDGSATTNCGLGREAAVELALSPRGAELARALWPMPLADDGLRAVQAVVAAWVERQDQLDRDRNHFLKAFRSRHGFDRNAYTPEQLAQYEAGLAEVNARVEAERHEAVRALARVSRTTG